MKGVALTIDLGNSAIKFVRWSRPPIAQRFDWGEDWSEALEVALQPCGDGDVVVVGLSSVASSDRLAAVTRLCRDRVGDVRVNPPPGLLIACRDPHTIGRDRLLAALGAWSAREEAALILDAGTALTVDALGVRDGAGVFLGGAIAPGPALLARSLGEGGANLFMVNHECGGPALGQDTSEAMAAGVRVGFRGAALELVRAVGEEAGLSTAPLWLTGGASELLATPELFTSRVVHRSPRLVHHGLRSALGLDRVED